MFVCVLKHSPVTVGIETGDRVSHGTCNSALLANLAAGEPGKSLLYLVQCWDYRCTLLYSPAEVRTELYCLCLGNRHFVTKL